MQNSNSNDGATADSSTQPKLKRQAKLLPNPMLPAVQSKKAKCYNCKFAGQQFKVGDKTHLHCHNEELYPSADFESGRLCAWDTLMEWWSTCKSHEFIQA